MTVLSVTVKSDFLSKISSRMYLLLLAESRETHFGQWPHYLHWFEHHGFSNARARIILRQQSRAPILGLGLSEGNWSRDVSQSILTIATESAGVYEDGVSAEF